MVTGMVETDCVNRELDIERGTKQGGPLSSLLLNSVCEALMRQIKSKWQGEKYGIFLEGGCGEKLTNLQFADAILLMARSLPHMTNMLADLSKEAGQGGSQVHPDKTKTLHNSSRRHIPWRVIVEDMAIEVLPSYASTKYLGRKTCPS